MSYKQKFYTIEGIEGLKLRLQKKETNICDMLCVRYPEKTNIFFMTIKQFYVCYLCAFWLEGRAM